MQFQSRNPRSFRTRASDSTYRHSTHLYQQILTTAFRLFIAIIFLAVLDNLRAYSQPPPVIDPTGRSGEPPPLQKDQPKPVPAPGLVLPPIPPAQPSSPEQLPALRANVRRINV